MTVTLWNDVFAAGVRFLPTLFLLGAPVLLLVIALAAIVDTKIPHGGGAALQPSR